MREHAGSCGDKERRGWIRPILPGLWEHSHMGPLGEEVETSIVSCEPCELVFGVINR